MIALKRSANLYTLFANVETVKLQFRFDCNFV